MKVISAGLLAHLAQDTTTLATCVKVTRRDGLILGYTTHDQPLTFDADGLGAVTYQAQGGYKRSAIASQLGLATDNVELEGIFDDEALTDEDLLNGLYDNAELKFMQVNWQDLTQGVLKLRRGYLGQAVLHRTTWVAEIRGLMDAYAQVIGEVYTPDCRADLGDARCKVPLAPPPWAASHAYTIGNRVSTTAQPLRHYVCTVAGSSGSTEPAWSPVTGSTITDGGCTWETVLASTVEASVASVEPPAPGVGMSHTFTVAEDLSAFGAVPEGTQPWFAMGAALWQTGNNSGVRAEIKLWEPTTGTVTLFYPLHFPIEPGDTMLLEVGCDKSLDTCIGRFDNVENFRGEPYLPGLNKALDYPSPHVVS